MTRAKIIVLACLAATLGDFQARSADAKVKWERDKKRYPAEHFDTYREGLKVRNSGVRHACVVALSRYAEGYPLILEYVRQPTNGPTRFNAIRHLKVYAAFPGYEEQLLSLKQLLETVPAKKRDYQVSHALNEIDRQLFAVAPKKYARAMLLTLRAYLEEQGSNISFSYDFEKKIQALRLHLDREALYVLVPVLADRLKDGFFSDTYQRAHASLKLITTESFPYNSGSKRSRAEVAEKYRELYYTKLLSEIPEEYREAK